jgi:hypothetical protein
LGSGGIKVEKILKSLPERIQESSMKRLEFTDKQKHAVMLRLQDENSERRPFLKKKFNPVLSLMVLATLVFLIVKIPSVDDQNIDFYTSTNGNNITGIVTGINEVKKEFKSFEFPTYVPMGFIELETTGVYTSPNNSTQRVLNSKYCKRSSCVYILQRNSPNPPTAKQFKSDSITTIKGHKAYVFNQENRKEIVVWRDGDVFSIKGSVSVRELKKITESLQTK